MGQWFGEQHHRRYRARNTRVTESRLERSTRHYQMVCCHEVSQVALGWIVGSNLGAHWAVTSSSEAGLGEEEGPFKFEVAGVTAGLLYLSLRFWSLPRCPLVRVK